MKTCFIDSENEYSHLKACCFIGHRVVEDEDSAEENLEVVVDKLLKDGVRVFYFGSKSRFDDLAWKVVTNYQSDYPDIERIYVRAAYANIDKSYREYLLDSYEDTFMPQGVEKSGRAAYVERNYKMIDMSEACVFYYNEKYVPQGKRSKKSLYEKTAKSGTKIAYDYAMSKKKDIYNVFE